MPNLIHEPGFFLKQFGFGLAPGPLGEHFDFVCNTDRNLSHVGASQRVRIYHRLSRFHLMTELFELRGVQGRKGDAGGERCGD